MNKLDRILAVLALALGLPALAAAQGVYYTNNLTSTQGTAIVGAHVAVCTTTSDTTTFPCSSAAAIYTNEALTTTKANPFTTSSTGQYNFWAAPGHYIIQLYGSGITSRIIDIYLSTGSTPSGNGIEYVSSTGLNTNDGMSWATAKATIASAVSALPSGGIIHLSGTQAISGTKVTVSTGGIKIECKKGAGFDISGSGARLIMNSKNGAVIGCSFTGKTTAQAVTSTADGFVFRNNTVSGFSTRNGANGELQVYKGNGDKILNNTFSNNVNWDIFIDPNSRGQTVKNLVIAGNKAGEIILHATGSGTTIKNVTINGNVLSPDQNSKVEFCSEVQTLSGGVIQNVSGVGNSCTMTAAGDGGFSWAGIDRGTLAGNTFYSDGFAPAVGGIEIVYCTDCAVTGNTLVNSASTGRGISVDRANDSTVVGNVIDGFGTGRATVGIQVVVAATTSPSASGDTISGNTIKFASGGAGIGIWQLCDATGATCKNNTYTSNTIISDGTKGSTGIRIENDKGTTSGILVANNNYESLATAFSGFSLALVHMTASGTPRGFCKTGSTYTNLAGAAGATFYVCEAGAWVAK